ncbi:MAG: heavy metal translocating P-type ATPase [Deltaproteobacteria bacterium]|nr:heavy metal translocating P-type ATPase [Deltaproteobacteria bacterium]
MPAESKNEPAALRFKIRGMDCAEEVTALKRELVPLCGGEERIVFDVLRGKMTIAPGAPPVTAQAIREAVGRTGMEALPWSEASPGPVSGWARHGRLWMCAASGLLLLGGFVVQALLRGGVVQALAGKAQALPWWAVLPYLGAAISGAWFILPRALLALRKLRPDMNLLMTIAAAGAVAIGEWFEAATVTFLFSLALLLESWSVGRARRAIQALVAVTPPMARLRSGPEAPVTERAVAEVPVGATVLVRPGERVPLDGVLLAGTTEVDQSPITGESRPVPKTVGDQLFAGTINGDGAIELRTTSTLEDTQLSRIVRMVEEAQSRRAPSEQWVERFARIYTPVMLALAVLLATVPPLIAGGGWGRWLYQALVLLVIACPCALVISTPVSVVSGLTAAARAGILIKGGAFLETAAHLKGMALDKTGTLTHGRARVQKVLPLNEHTEGDLLRIAAALESNSTHPLARAVLDYAAKALVEAKPAESFQALQGLGAEGVVDGTRYWIGSHRLLEERGQETPEIHQQAATLEDAGHSLVAIGNDRHVCGLISVGDGVREAADGVVRALHDLGLEKVVMLTGDNRHTAEAVGVATGVDEIKAELLPGDKVKAVEDLARRLGVVAMVGDGVNDAPALAASSLGIAMGGIGTAAAVETADVTLIADDLGRLPWLVEHARRTLRVIHQNIYFALGVKALFLVLAAANLATLWMAIAADMGASLLVVANGLRLLSSGVKGDIGKRAANADASPAHAAAVPKRLPDKGRDCWPS